VRRARSLRLRLRLSARRFAPLRGLSARSSLAAVTCRQRFGFASLSAGRLGVGR